MLRGTQFAVAVSVLNTLCTQELFEALHSKLRAGKPGYHRTSYMVQENSFFHIPASQEVRQHDGRAPDCLRAVQPGASRASRWQSLPGRHVTPAAVMLKQLMHQLHIDVILLRSVMHEWVQGAVGTWHICTILIGASVTGDKTASIVPSCHMPRVRAADWISCFACCFTPSWHVRQPVEVLWIHNQQWKEWERLLPPETQSKLLTDRKGRSGNGKGVHHKSVMEREKFDGELEESLYGGVSSGFVKTRRQIPSVGT